MSRRCYASPWWPTNGGLEPGVDYWEHTRMGMLNIRDLYWAAKNLNLTGTVRTNLGDGTFSGESLLLVEDPHELLDYRARTCPGIGSGGEGQYSINANYVFAGPLHWDSTNGTFCPELVFSIALSLNVSPPAANLGSIDIDPAGGGLECGTVYLMQSFPAFLRLPLYYHGGVLTGVSAEAILDGERWVFE